MGENEYEFVGDQEYWKPTVVDEKVEGVVVSAETGNFGLSVTIRQPDGTLLAMPAHKALQKRLASVKVGDKILVIYKGTVPSKKGQPARLYRVGKLQ